MLKSTFLIVNELFRNFRMSSPAPRNELGPELSDTHARPGARRSGLESARVYDSIRRQMLEGQLAAGTHLSQQIIAQAEGTSNGPVISALRRTPGS